MRKTLVLIAFIMLSLVTNISAVTVAKYVGHGDSYIVTADGRIVVIDVGPGNASGLVDFLTSGHVHYDRIIITHVHADHVGGLVTAARYVEETGSALSTDLLVSNHGEHDLDLIVRDTKIPDLLKEMREKDRTVAVLKQEALNSLAFEDPHLRVEAISFPPETAGGKENQTSLIVKITEIRDGKSRATLFLGDIEAPQQQALFENPEAQKIFENVRAVTIPHHGRKATLLPDFFGKLRAVTNNDIVALHSDQKALDPEVRSWARAAGIKILSTAPTTKKGTPHDLHVNLFEDPTYFIVKQPTTIETLASKGMSLPIAVPKEVSIEEFVESISTFNKRTSSEVLPSGCLLNLPTKNAIIKHSDSVRERLISEIQSEDPDTRNTAITNLSKLGKKLNREQIDKVVKVMQTGDSTVETTSQRGAHCTYYDEKKAKYYAGNVLARLDSPYVTAAIRKQARRAQTKEGGGVTHRRVDDPGWI